MHFSCNLNACICGSWPLSCLLLSEEAWSLLWASRSPYIFLLKMSIPCCAGLITFQNVLKTHSKLNFGEASVLLVFRHEKQSSKLSVIRVCVLFPFGSVFFLIFLYMWWGGGGRKVFFSCVFLSFRPLQSLEFFWAACVLSEFMSSQAAKWEGVCPVPAVLLVTPCLRSTLLFSSSSFCHISCF